MRIPREDVLEARRDIESIIGAQKTVVYLFQLLGKLPIWKIEYFGEEHLLADEPAVVLASHQNSFDVHALGCAHLEATGTPLSFLAKEGVMDNPIANAVLGRLGAIAIKRKHETKENESTNRNRAPLLKALARLQAGGPVGAFGEGKRTYGGNIAPIEPSAVSIAAKAGVDVVTAGVYGPSKPSPYSPRPITIVFGSRTNPADIDKNDRPEFYRRQIQHDYDTALAVHHGRLLPTDA
jgi:1-acyl-sn-glycerol-3-phosphate acyltransferase